LASSCSKNGINAVANETICNGEVVIKLISFVFFNENRLFSFDDIYSVLICLSVVKLTSQTAILVSPSCSGLKKTCN